MKDILKHYSKYILLDTLVAATLFAGAHGILSLFHLKFIEWFYYAVIGIITIGILLGIFQLLLKIRKNYVKYVAICVEAICLIPLTCNGVQREHNKKLNNGLPILHKVPPKRDYGRYFCIMAEKGGTSHGGLTEKLSPFFHAKKQEVNAYGR